VLGKSEPALHLSFSLFTLLAAFCFFRMVEDVSPSRAGPLTVLFVLGPHLLPGQNLMTDVPMMALWLAAMRAHLSAARRIQHRASTGRHHRRAGRGRTSDAE
jgi:4-amino-4-deoxy-L-arabinose transferase-like glycosyltransferase